MYDTRHYVVNLYLAVIAMEYLRIYKHLCTDNNSGCVFYVQT